MPLGACSGGSRQAAATKGGDEQGAAGRGDDGDKGKKQAEETTAAKEGEKNGDGKGRRRGEEAAATKIFFVFHSPGLGMGQIIRYFWKMMKWNSNHKSIIDGRKFHFYYVFVL